MSDKIKENIENNQEKNLNKPEGNRNWWRKLLGLNPTYRLSFDMHKMDINMFNAVFKQTL